MECTFKGGTILFSLSLPGGCCIKITRSGKMQSCGERSTLCNKGCGNALILREQCQLKLTPSPKRRVSASLPASSILSPCHPCPCQPPVRWRHSNFSAILSTFFSSCGTIQQNLPEHILNMRRARVLGPPRPPYSGCLRAERPDRTDIETYRRFINKRCSRKWGVGLGGLWPQ